MLYDLTKYQIRVMLKEVDRVSKYLPKNVEGTLFAMDLPFYDSDLTEYDIVNIIGGDPDDIFSKVSKIIVRWDSDIKIDIDLEFLKYGRVHMVIRSSKLSICNNIWQTKHREIFDNTPYQKLIPNTIPEPKRFVFSAKGFMDKILTLQGGHEELSVVSEPFPEEMEEVEEIEEIGGNITTVSVDTNSLNTISSSN